MSDFTSGLLGGLIGTSHAVSQLSEERRHEMALNLRREALAEIEKTAATTRFGREKEMQLTDIKARKAETEAGITSREKIASDKTKSLEKMAAAEMKMKERLLAADKKSTEAQNLRAMVAAFTEARKIIEGGGSTDEANAVLGAAGLPLMEEYIIEEGREGILGFGQKDPIIGRRVAGSAGLAAPAPQSGKKTPSATTNIATGKDWMQGWVDKAKTKKQPAGTAYAAESEETPTEGIATPSKKKAEPDTEKKTTGYEVDGKEIFNINDEMYVMEEGEYRPLTDDEWFRRKKKARKPKNKKKAVADVRNLPGKIKKASKANPSPLYGN